MSYGVANIELVFRKTAITPKMCPHPGWLVFRKTAITPKMCPHCGWLVFF